MKKYILRNKDIDILEFNVESFLNEKTLILNKKIEISKIHDENFPVQLRNSVNLEESIARFISSRKIPQNRSFAKRIIEETGNDPFMGYIDISFGLSLNDSLWIVPEKKSDLKWEEVNLYKNPFSERLQMASFGLGYEGNSPYKISPEFTTNGMLKKCWIRENDKIFLLKSNSETGFDFASKHVEVFSEYYTSQIAKLFKPNSITYDIIEFNGELCSKCQIFTTENRGYLPITAFLTEEELKKGEKILADRSYFIEKAVSIYGKENFEDLMLFDAIIGNRDRHLGNFGMIVNNNTFEVLNAAPIFDNGESILNYYNFNKNLEFGAYSSRTNSLGQRFNKVFKNYVQQRHKNFFKKLKTFKFERHPEYNLSENILASFEKHLHSTSERALKIIENKNKTNKNQDKLKRTL